MPDGIFQFGTFELNKRSGELRKNGARIKLQEQPFQILILLLEHPGEIVDREQIRTRLWPDHTFVDFDNAISSAVRKLREGLGDSADNPRFIETVAKRGYRFIGQIQARSAAIAKPKRPRMKWPVIAAGMLLIIAVVAWWLWFRGEPNTAQLTPVPLTAAPGWEMQPSFSPDGNQIAYAWDETNAGNNTHIYVKMIGSGRPVQVTVGTGPDSVPAWSPDGRSIAFIRTQGQSSAIYSIPPSGGAERKIADGYFVGTISWSPNGRLLAVADRKSPNDSSSLYLVESNDGHKVPLTTPPGTNIEDRTPLFSPDGRTLLFTRCRKLLLCGLYLLDLSSDYHPRGEPRQFRQESGAIWEVAWTADGKGAVYSSATRGGWNPHLMKIRMKAGARPERLTYAGENIFELATAPRGNRLAYTQELTDADLLELRPGKDARSFASSRRSDYYPQYSPDGKRIAFESDRSGEFEIWSCDASGQSPTQLTHIGERVGSPRWSPDGRSLAFDRQLTDGWHIFVMAADGGQVRQLTSHEGDQVIPSWSVDGNWIYYANKQAGRFEIWKMRAEGGKGLQVTHNGGFVASESHDGRVLYYTKDTGNSSGLWELPVGGGNERRVLESVGVRAFVVRDDGIYYIPVLSADGDASVWFYDFATGKSKKITSFTGNFAGGLTVSPDRETMLLTALGRTGSNVMVVDNFR
ncbi:MAG TPA: winged helix-turn-helix domain-containing protein [Bryobacteraceae bacterium]